MNVATLALLSTALLAAGCRKPADEHVNAVEANAAVTTDANATAAEPAVLTGTPKEIIEARQKKFKEIGKANKAIQEALKKPAPDVAVIAPAARALETLAAEQPGWFPAGSGPEAGVKTGAKAEIWTRADAFKEKLSAFRTAAQALNAAAASGDLAKVKPAAAEIGKSCKGCHDDFRAKDDD